MNKLIDFTLDHNQPIVVGVVMFNFGQSCILSSEGVDRHGSLYCGVVRDFKEVTIVLWSQKKPPFPLINLVIVKPRLKFLRITYSPLLLRITMLGCLLYIHLILLYVVPL